MAYYALHVAFFAIVIFVIFILLAASSEGPLVGLTLLVGWIALSVYVWDVWHEPATPVPSTLELPKAQWLCTSSVVVSDAPIYVKSGSVMVPVGGGSHQECVQYSRRSR